VLGVELYRLWRVGRRELPELGRLYGRAARQLRSVSHDGGGWNGLRLELVSVFARAERQVGEAAESVCAAADGYAAADANAATELRAVILAREALPAAGERR
jgi:hypothetical protein